MSTSFPALSHLGFLPNYLITGRKRKNFVKKVRFFLRIFRLDLRIFDVFKVLRQQSIYCQENNISYAPTTTFVSRKMCHVKKDVRYLVYNGVSVDIERRKLLVKV